MREPRTSATPSADDSGGGAACEYADAVRRAAAGDVGAFEDLVRRFQGAAFACATNLLGDRHLAEDAVQEAFLEAHRGLRTLGAPEAFPSWLRTIVRHRCARRLRRRDLEVTDLDDRAPDLRLDDAPEESLARRERHALALRAVRELPRPLREAVTVFHLCDCTQAEAAAFLGVPLTTLNNRLHQARTLLRRRMLTMVTESLRETGLPDDFAARIGRVLRVQGPLVEARFDADRPPDVFDSLRAADGAVEMRVAQVLEDGVVRCIVTAGGGAAVAGQPLTNATADGGVAKAPAADDATVARAVAAFGHARPDAPAVLETGIKSVDLFCPLPVLGNVGLFGTSGTGKMVLAQELVRRLAGRPDAPRIFYMAAPTEPAIVRDLQASAGTWTRDVEGGAQRVWILSDLATDPTYAARTDRFDSTVHCSLPVAAHGIWPATDPVHSASRAAVTARHADVARRARAAIADAKRLMSDPLFLEYLACRAVAAARPRLAECVPARLAELDAADLKLVARARRLERFLSTPFYVAEEDTRRPGRTVALTDTLDGAEAILDGACDAIPEERFVLAGTLAEIRGI